MSDKDGWATLWVVEPHDEGKMWKTFTDKKQKCPKKENWGWEKKDNNLEERDNNWDSEHHNWVLKDKNWDQKGNI